jgi:MFS family permease
MKRMPASIRIMLIIGSCGALAIFSSTISKSPILPIFAKSLGATGAEIGLIASASTIPGILISYIAGDLADRFGYRKILVGSLLIFASAPFIYLVVRNPLELGAVRFYHGFATAAFGPVAMAVVAAFSRKNTGQNLSLYSSATMIGRALAPTAGGVLYDGAGTPGVYLVAGVAGLLALAMAVYFLRKPMKSEEEETSQADTPKEIERIPFMKKLWALLGYRPLLLVGILEACAYFAYGAFEMVFPLYAKQLGMSAGVIGLLIGIQLVGIILFKPVFGRMSDHLGRLPMMVAGLAACAVSFFLLALLKSTIAIIPLILFYELGFALITASTSALAADVARAGQLGASLGVLSTLMDIGQTIGPPAIGALSDAYSYSTGIGALGVILLLAATGCVIALAKQRRFVKTA